MEESDTQIIPIADIAREICKKLKCSSLAEDLGRVNHVREMLAILQQKEAFDKLKGKPTHETSLQISEIFRKTKIPICSSNTSDSEISLNYKDALEEEDVEGAEGFETAALAHCEALSDDSWLGFFKGYEMLTEDEEFPLSENKQCVEISPSIADSKLAFYLRAGVRCFVIDLFKGTGLDNQRLIFRLRESELNISREYGFPITVTLFAMLSPRCQFTGILEPYDAIYDMQKGDLIILSSDRRYSLKGTREKVYVNARFLIDDCRLGDFILVGPSLQIRIIAIDAGDMHCEIMEPGFLRSRTPVRFPGRCNRYDISVEEIEDISFAREVGINVLVSYIAGNTSYLKDLQNVLHLLKCEHFRLCCRIVLNDLKCDTDEDLLWVADRYDGFIIDFNPQQNRNRCHDPHEDDPHMSYADNLHLSSAAVNLSKKIFQSRKPFILNPKLIADRKLFVGPCNWPEIYYYTDKYLFKCDHTPDSFYFYLMQDAIFNQMIKSELSTQPFCDESHTGSDSMARSCIATAWESQASAILVCSLMPDMCIDLSHFRPTVPIIYITSAKSTGDYISMYHNIVQLYFRNMREDCPHHEVITKGLIFGLMFLTSRKAIENGQNVILVYGHENGTQLPDKYVVYKFDEKKFPEHLNVILFR